MLGLMYKDHLVPPVPIIPPAATTYVASCSALNRSTYIFNVM